MECGNLCMGRNIYIKDLRIVYLGGYCGEWDVPICVFSRYRTLR